MVRRWALLCVLLFVALAPPTPAEDIPIGMSAAFTGQSRALGIELYRGSIAVLDQVNREGGVHGHKIVLKAYDDGYNPLPAVSNTSRLVDRDGVFLLFDYVGTPTVTRVLPLLKMDAPKSVFLLFPFTGALPQRVPPYGHYVFNLRASYYQETEGLVDHFADRGFTRFGVFYQIDAYGRSGWEGTRTALAKRGLHLAGESTYQRGAEFTEDMSRQVEILRQERADVVISVGSYAACAAFIRDARNAGWKVPVANLSFVGAESLLALLRQEGQRRGRDYTGNLVISQVVPSYEATNLPAVRDYRELLGHLGNRLPPEIHAADYAPLPLSSVSFEGFLNARLLVEILRRLGDPPLRTRLAETIESIHDLDLGIGVPVSFGVDRHQGMDTVFYTTVRDGRLVPLDDWSQFVP